MKKSNVFMRVAFRFTKLLPHLKYFILLRKQKKPRRFISARLSLFFLAVLHQNTTFYLSKTYTTTIFKLFVYACANTTEAVEFSTSSKAVIESQVAASTIVSLLFTLTR